MDTEDVNRELESVLREAQSESLEVISEDESKGSVVQKVADFVVRRLSMAMNAHAHNSILENPIISYGRTVQILPFFFKLDHEKLRELVISSGMADEQPATVVQELVLESPAGHQVRNQVEEFLRTLVASTDGLDQQLSTQPGPICKESEVMEIMRGFVRELRDGHVQPRSAQPHGAILSDAAQADEFLAGVVDTAREHWVQARMSR